MPAERGLKTWSSEKVEKPEHVKYVHFSKMSCLNIHISLASPAFIWGMSHLHARGVDHKETLLSNYRIRAEDQGGHVKS